MERANERLKDQHARTIAANLVALIFVSLADLTQDQRHVLTSLTAHGNRALADCFCTPKDFRRQSSGHCGRKTFLVIEEGYLDKSEGSWVEDEEDGTEFSSKRTRTPSGFSTTRATRGSSGDSKAAR